MDDPDFEARAARRRGTWVAELGTGHRAMRVEETSVEERIAVMKDLAETGWALRGESLPSYSRAEMPGRVLREAGRG